MLKQTASETGGDQGLTGGIPRPPFLGIHLDEIRHLYLFCCTLLVVSLFIIRHLVQSPPAEVDHALRVKAAQRKQSLNRVVLDELTRALVGKPVRTDFSDLVGKWVPDPGFDKVIASQRKIDAGKWK